jgi:phi13 family phage major tail protein
MPDGKEVFGKPVRMAKAIQAQMSTQIAEAKLYADDGIDESAKEFVSGSLTLNINDLQSTHQAYLLGQKTDADGVIYADGDDEAPYVAVGFRATKTRGRFKYIWLYKVKFAIPDENYQTKGESIAFQTPSIVGTYQKRNDGKWKADYVGLPTEPTAQEWFEKVREINPIPVPPAPIAGSLNIGGANVGGGISVNGGAVQPLNVKGVQ